MGGRAGARAGVAVTPEALVSEVLSRYKDRDLAFDELRDAIARLPDSTSEALLLRLITVRLTDNALLGALQALITVKGKVPA